MRPSGRLIVLSFAAAIPAPAVGLTPAATTTAAAFAQLPEQAIVPFFSEFVVRFSPPAVTIRFPQVLLAPDLTAPNRVAADAQ
jgi:hypothetical protein